LINTPADVDNRPSDCVNDDVAVLSSPVANDDVTVVTEQNDAECNDVGEDSGDISDGGSALISVCSLLYYSKVAQEQRNDPSLTGCWKLAEKCRAGFLVNDCCITVQRFWAKMYRPA